jgi:methionine salvage enolase-phosphatase E1
MEYKCSLASKKSGKINFLKAKWIDIFWFYKAKTGFLTISDGIAGNTGAAIEEVAVISLHQFIAQQDDQKSRHQSKLLSIPNVIWATGFESSEIRKNQHLKKMQTKIPRAEAQIKLLGIPMGTVEHIIL